jgi:hypothetical protein
MPFASKAQQRFMFSQHPKIAKKWAHVGPEGYIKKLPARIRTNKDRAKAKRAVGSYQEAVRNIMLGDRYG